MKKNETEAVSEVEKADAGLGSGATGYHHPDGGTPWEAKLPEAVEQAIEIERDAREIASDLGLLAIPPVPATVAREMENRSRYLRSRPMPDGALGRWEKKMLAELDGLEAEARALHVQWQMNALSAMAMAKETEVLFHKVYAVRGRYADLLAALDEGWPSRARPEDPEKRKKELSEIEAFLERKKARAKKGGQ